MEGGVVDDILDKFISYYIKYYETLIERFIDLNSRCLNTLNGLFLGDNTAVFRAKIQRGGRINIPSIELERLKLKEGEIVKIILIRED